MTAAHELMIDFPEPMHASATLRQVMELLLTHHDIRNVPVIDEERRLVGLVGQRELNAILHPLLPLDACACSAFQAALDATVAQVMATDVHVVDEETDVFEISDLMINDNLVALPVIDANGRYLGMISYVDVLHELALHATAAA